LSDNYALRNRVAADAVLSRPAGFDEARLLCYNKLVYYTRESNEKGRETAMTLYFYDGILKDGAVSRVIRGDVVQARRLLFGFAENEAFTNDIFREYVVRLMTESVNAFSTACGGRRCGNTLLSFAKRDIAALFRLMRYPLFPAYERAEENNIRFKAYQTSVRGLCAARNAEAFFGLLTAHYETFGCGAQVKYTAFRFNGKLHGIEAYDGVDFDGLVGLEQQKQILVSNTAAFVAGKPANNVLLYGGSGCGKSSSVKALLPLFQDDGLRLVEFPKERLRELPALFGRLREMPYKFIIYLDDLSFENDDIDYKTLKVIMEGGLARQSPNILVYATSNRRRLVSERWTDRDGGEVHASDAAREKTSLSERFGIRVAFTTPTQEEYLRIVEDLLRREQIALTPQIKKEAIQWELRYNGRSGRTAKQFAANLIAAKD
jgi:predicted AAA+ superfamily ATPase